MTISGLPLPHSPPTLPYTLVEGEDDSSGDDAYSTGSFEKYRKNYHPLYIEYEKERRNQDNRYDTHWSLTADRARLEDQQSVRRGVGLKLQKEDQDFLRSLPGLICSLSIEIEESSHKIDQLRAQCQEQRVIDLDDSEDSEDSTSLPPIQSALPSLPTPTPPSPPFAGLSLIANTISTPLDDASQNHITSWLFDKLTASYTELDLLVTILSITGTEPSLVSLPNIRSLWDRDGAGLAPPRRLGALDGDTLSRLQCVTREVIDNGYDRALVRSLFGLSLWGGGTCKRGGESDYLNDSAVDGDTEPEMTPLTLTQAIGLGKSLSWPRSQGLSPRREALPDCRSAASCSGKRLYSSSGQTLSQSHKPLSLPGGIPIQKQHRAEEIYAALVLVETRCTAAVEKAQLAKESELNNGQALIDVHMELLSKHHNFLLACQDSSATDVVQDLPVKHDMPARLWRHAIHGFLELLRNRLPASLDCMLAFINYAYSTMTLFLETVLAFKDTWLENLGNLGRYRMDIEDDNEDEGRRRRKKQNLSEDEDVDEDDASVRDREVWAHVARRWYLESSNRSPITGRLYYHLATLAYPDALLQLLYYGKSLAVPVPFTAARESIMALFELTLNPVTGRCFSAIIRAIVHSHAIIFTGQSLDMFNKILMEIRMNLNGHIVCVKKEYQEQGYYIAISNCIALYGYGIDDNPLTLLLKPRSSDANTITSNADSTTLPTPTLSPTFNAALCLFIQTTNTHLLRVNDTNTLSFIHVTLVFIRYLAHFPSAASLIFPKFNWNYLVRNLNTLAGLHPPNFAVIESPNLPMPGSNLHPSRETLLKQPALKQLDIAGQHDDVTPAKDIFRPFPEEWAMQGLSFTEGYFPKGWFANENVEPETHYLETESIRSQHRPERVLWLGAQITKRLAGKWMVYVGAEGYADEGRGVIFRLA
ncbi:hypothetical protein V500_02324 [Pseudogymnoascus sp. VKM F-4518 (FW-2643)]|nr:hypothetical protein V500_02324 [Pseudogymnoascus sp. VKM F-4518 (FW-2643)]